MNNYVKRIVDNVDINNIDAINQYIENLNISNNSKRMYAYWISKHLTELGMDNSKLVKYEQIFITKKNDLTFDEVQKCKANIDNLELKFVFNALLETGMRIEEFVSVDWSDVKDEQISIKTIKNKYEYRDTFIASETLNDLFELKATNYNFSNINIKHIQYILSKFGKKIQLSIPLSPHVLRRTKGSLLRLNGVSIEDIADILGHKNLETSRKYYSKLNSQYIKSISAISGIKPSESIDIQSLIAENKLLKKKIVLLEQEIQCQKAKHNKWSI